MVVGPSGLRVPLGVVHLFNNSSSSYFIRYYELYWIFGLDSEIYGNYIYTSNSKKLVNLLPLILLKNIKKKIFLCVRLNYDGFINK